MTFVRLAPLALAALLAASCSGNDKSSSATTTTTSATTTGATGSGNTGSRPPTSSSSTGRLAVGKRDLYPLLAGSLARYVSKPVSAKSATIVQVAGIDSFWAGRNDGKRVLVKIDLKGQRPPKLETGQQVSFVGRFVKAPKLRDSVGVKPKTGLPLLTKQGVYILVPISKLKLQ